MTITAKAWNKYITTLRRLSDRAANETMAYIKTLVDQGITGQEQIDLVIDYCYALVTKYGEAGAAAACDMYDAIMELQGANLPPAMPAPTATRHETAKAVVGTYKTGNPKIVGDAAGRLVKMASADTMQQNALRDGCEWAWVPQGDTCAFCITLASRGWQKASKTAIKNGHAEHIHANCDCTYCVRYKPNISVEGYDPQMYLDMYYDADGSTPEQRINALRREFYADNKDVINAQKRSAYAKRKELNSSAAEEVEL